MADFLFQKSQTHLIHHIGMIKGINRNKNLNLMLSDAKITRNFTNLLIAAPPRSEYTQIYTFLCQDHRIKSVGL